jgi:hypothetical protein
MAAQSQCAINEDAAQMGLEPVNDLIEQNRLVSLTLSCAFHFFAICARLFD